MPTSNPYASPDSDESVTVSRDSRLGWGFAVSCLLTFLLVFTLPLAFYVYARAWIASTVGVICLVCSLATVRRGGWGCAGALLMVTLLLVATAWSMTPVWQDFFGFGAFNEYDSR